MIRVPFASRIGAVIASGVFVIALAGCAPQVDQAQAPSSEDTDLRAMIASDHQQITSLQQQVGRLNDQLTEYQHNDTASVEGGKGDGSDQPSGAEPAPPAGSEPSPQASPAASPSMSDASSNATPPPGSPDASASPSSPSPAGQGDSTSGGPPPPVPGDTAATGPAPSSSGPSTEATTAAAADDNNDKDNNSDNQAGAETASTGPPSAPAPPTEISPPSTWQGSVDDQIAAASASSDPAAKPYRAGLIAMKAGMYPVALAKFQDLQRKYPKSPLSEPAEYFSGNALFEMGKYEQAILQFNDLTMRFPSGQYASQSLLREAQAFQKINDQVDARLTLQKLLNDHPNSPEAAAAKSMMQGMASG